MELEIRPLHAWEEYRACETLQKETWGEDFSELAPASLLKIARRLGGVASGAFDPEGRLAGFVFGLTGLEDGRPVHWSHMLAVRPEHRRRGLGRRLKEHQRDAVQALGVRRMYWTFEPLLARNAHFNLNVLGVRVVEYVRDMYGETGSELHRGLGTDRFVVAWEWDGTVPEPGAGAGHGTAAAERADTSIPQADASPPTRGPAGAVEVEIPPDVLALRDRDPEAAAAWRRRTRESLEPRLAAGWRVAGFGQAGERFAYRLVPPDVREGS